MTQKVKIFPTGDTYMDHRKNAWDLFAYSPTDCPQNTYTSSDMARSVAIMEHGRIEVEGERKPETEDPRRGKRRQRTDDDEYGYRD